MATIQLNGRITEAGGLEIELPPGLPRGEARITIENPTEPTWKPEELDQALTAVPLTGTEIVNAGLTGGWSDTEIPDCAKWVAARKGRARSGGRAVVKGNFNFKAPKTNSERITTNPGQCGGRPCIRGMRIRVSDVLDLLAAGLTSD